MKNYLTFPRAALLALALGISGVTAMADDASTTPTTKTAPDTTSVKHHRHSSVLTSDERAQLKKAREAALTANPDLKSEHDSLKQKFASIKNEGDSATIGDIKALHAQAHDFRTKMRAAELKVDPTLSSVFAKLEAAHQGFHHHSA